MKQVIVAVLVSISSFAACFAENPSFTYEIDKQFRRPLLRWPVPSDENKEKPRDVLINFLDAVRLKNYETAETLCYFGWRLGDGSEESWETIKGDTFLSICEEINANIKEIKISGSTVRQKSGYFSIWCRITTKEDAHAELNIYLIRQDGAWKVRETSVSKFRYQLLRIDN